MAHIHDLPPELLHQVLRELQTEIRRGKYTMLRRCEHFNFAKVCRRWHDYAFEVYRRRRLARHVPECKILALWKQRLALS